METQTHKTKFTTEYHQCNTIMVSDISFLYSENFDKNTFIMWVGGRNGSGQPQLPRRGQKNQVAAREIYKMFYGNAAALLNSKSHVHVVTEVNDNMNPYAMRLVNTNVNVNDPNRYLDVSNKNDFMARFLIESFLKAA